jgi:hypothetical protein
MDPTRSAHWEVGIKYRIVCKSEAKGMCRCDCSIAVDIEETGYEDVDWIRLAPDRVQW